MARPSDRNCPVVQRTAYVLEKCRGKRVLHLGCADSPFTREKLEAATLLHPKIVAVAAKAYGLDVDADGVRVLTEGGQRDLFVGSVEDMNVHLPERDFDIVVAGELIEHLDNPGLFLDAVKRVMSSSTRLLITTPNAYCLYRILTYLLGGRDNVHPDHNYWFSKKVLTTLLGKHGYAIEEFAFYPVFAEELPTVDKRIALIDRFTAKYFPHFSNGLMVLCVRSPAVVRA